MLNSLVIRVAAGSTLVVGGVLYAAQEGYIGSAASAQVQPNDRTLASSSRPARQMSPIPPEIETFNINVPMAEQELAPAAGVPPVAFDQTPDTLSPPISDVTELSPLGLPCDVTVIATAMPAAMVALDVMAPCRAEASVTVSHAGLRVVAMTDAVGLLTLDIPAFETPAFFSVTFENAMEETVLVGVPDLPDYDRIGLTWIGDMGLELHAMEFGAAFGDQGHIWQNAPGAPDNAVAGDGGFLTMLETDVSYAQVYTLPRTTLREGDSVRLSIDAPVTEDNCTQNVLARTLRAEHGGPVNVTELTFRVPDCDAVGDVLVLQNLLDDLRLASN